MEIIFWYFAGCLTPMVLSLAILWLLYIHDIHPGKGWKE